MSSVVRREEYEEILRKLEETKRKNEELKALISSYLQLKPFRASIHFRIHSARRKLEAGDHNEQRLSIISRRLEVAGLYWRLQLRGTGPGRLGLALRPSPMGNYSGEFQLEVSAQFFIFRPSHPDRPIVSFVDTSARNDESIVAEYMTILDSANGILGSNDVLEVGCKFEIFSGTIDHLIDAVDRDEEERNEDMEA